MNTTIKNGLLAGVISSIILVGLHFVSFELSQSFSVGLIMTLVFPVIFMVLAIIAVRNEQEGFISFGEALKTSFIVFMICAIVVGIAQFALYQTFTDDTWNKIVDIQLENAQDMMEMVGADETAMDFMKEELTIEKIKESTSGIGNMMLGLLVNAFIGLIISLIVSAIMKRNPTP